jgi:hypothetical protein
LGYNPAMPIPFQCPSCGATGTASEKAAGKIVQCPKCSSMVQVRDLADDAPPLPPPPIDDWPVQAVPVAVIATPKPVAPPTPERKADRPRSPAKKKRQWAPMDKAVAAAIGSTMALILFSVIWDRDYEWASFPTGLAVLCLVGAIVAIVRIASAENAAAAAKDAEKWLAEKVTSREQTTTELEALLRIDERLVNVERHLGWIQGQAGCLLFLLTVWFVLAFMGFFTVRVIVAPP